MVNGRKTFEKWHDRRVCEHQKSQSDMRGEQGMGEKTARGAMFFLCSYGAVQVCTFTLVPSAFLSVPTGPEGASTTTISSLLSMYF